MRPDLYDQLITKLDQNIYIQRMWDSVVKDQLPTAHSESLLHIVKLKFAKMCVTAYEAEINPTTMKMSTVHIHWIPC